MDTATDEGKARPTTARQDLVIDALLNGQTVVKAAETTGVGRRTIYDWMEKPEFRAELERRRGELAERVGEDTAEVRRLALEILKGYLSGSTEFDRSPHRI